MKKISIIIPLYNPRRLIGKCIASALDQDLPPEEYEVIVVDDGSTDGRWPQRSGPACGHANVQVHAKPNEGVSLARNYGTERAAGRYVMYVDADDYLSPSVLGGLTQIMDRERLDMLLFRPGGRRRTRRRPSALERRAFRTRRRGGAERTRFPASGLFPAHGLRLPLRPGDARTA